MNYLRTTWAGDISSDNVVWKLSIEPSDKVKEPPAAKWVAVAWDKIRDESGALSLEMPYYQCSYGTKDNSVLERMDVNTQS